jgi:hypothetical protein
MKTGTTLTLILCAVAVALAACGGPYKGKPEKLPKVKTTEEPEDTTAEGPAMPEIKWDEECSAKFTDDPSKAKKSASKAATPLSNGNDNMSRAAAASDDKAKVSNIVAAIDDFKKALLEDHYNAEATYQLAVAYAQVRKKGCALKMLKRLGELNNNPKLAGGAGRVETWLSQIEDEPAFRPFKNAALEAVGR